MTISDFFLFVSHVAEDRASAMEIVDELERRGARCWIAPRDVRPGEPFDNEIADAIDSSRAMLLIFSDRCNDSEYIRREVTFAGESRKIVIPFRIEDVMPRRGLRVRLSDLHWIDGFLSRERAIDEVIKRFAPAADASGSSPPAGPPLRDDGEQNITKVAEPKAADTVAEAPQMIAAMADAAAADETKPPTETNAADVVVEAPRIIAAVRDGSAEQQTPASAISTPVDTPKPRGADVAAAALDPAHPDVTNRSDVSRPESESDDFSEPLDTPVRPPRTNRWPIVIGGVAAVCILGFIVMTRWEKPSPPPPANAAAFSARGDADIDGNRFGQAIADYTEAIRLDPTDRDAYFKRARAYQVGMGDYDHAIADFTEAIRLDRTYALAFNGRGDVYQDGKKDYDRAIADYTEAIRLDPNLVTAFAHRGNAYRNGKQDYNRALADYNEVIRLDPNFATGFFNRGRVYEDGKQDYDRAIVDFTEAIRLDPSLMAAFFRRGMANLYTGAPRKAFADFRQASELDPENAYVALWLDIAAQRNNVPSELQAAQARIRMTDWPAPVIELFLGQSTPAALLVAADDPDPNTKKGQVCEANFYSGEWALRTGAKTEAIRLFRLARSDCPKDFDEWPAASRELAALGAR